MSDREKILAAAVGLLVALWGGNWAWQSYSQWKDSASKALASSTDELQDAELELKKAKYAYRQLNEWKKRSLPADYNLAKSRYRGWLVEQLEAAKLDVDDVKSRRTTSRSGAYQPLGYQVEATGRLEAIVSFLDAFYRSDQMHKISSLRMNPKQGSNDLTVSLAVEALVVDGTNRETELPSGTSDRLSLASVDEYVDSIVGRNPFVAYRKPPPPRPPRPPVVRSETPKPPVRPKFDHAKHASITGLVSVGNSFQAWVWPKTLGDNRLYLDPGDEVEVGLFKGIVVKVTARELVIETDKGLEVFHLDDTLADGELVSEVAGDS